jgi:hypothetical protein
MSYNDKIRICVSCAKPEQLCYCYVCEKVWLVDSGEWLGMITCEDGKENLFKYLYQDQKVKEKEDARKLFNSVYNVEILHKKKRRSLNEFFMRK